MADHHVQGIGVSSGIRIAKAYILSNTATSTATCATNEQIAPAALAAELDRLSVAKLRSENELMELANQAERTIGAQQAGIITGQAKMLSDPAYYPQIEKQMQEQLWSAATAIYRVTESIAAKFEQLNNSYMQERAADIRDLGHRLLSHVQGAPRKNLAELREEVILIAYDLAPSETIQLDKQYVKGIITQAGGKTSHTSILARSLGISAIVGAGEALQAIEDGELLIIDGDTGLCIRQPEPPTISAYEDKQYIEQVELASLERFRSQPAITKDGLRVEMAANIGMMKEASVAFERNAEGVGLYRTEILYMDKDDAPSEEEQFITYRDVVLAMQGRPVVIRTFDIGGDKELPYLKLPEEENPFLGYRAIRIGLDRQELLFTQLRAILRASHYGHVKLMFPMISSLDEWRQAKAMYGLARQQLYEEGFPLSNAIELGIMIEIPSAALLANVFAQEVDFFSIGTNDLVQYILAVDRMNEKVSYLYDYFHPAVLLLIQQVIHAAHRHGKWVGMCGGMAGDPLATPLLLGLGLDEWSMDSGSIVKIKKIISQLDSHACRELTARVLQLATTAEIRQALLHFVADLQE